ncbi:MAG: glycogen/starch/alpha-glucan phosphorylase [Candidatus Marinimicrobia bacterium]|nr:glycogen/starch/alpha-glucan phosphorylase [Candidatus Neomarinimicrobiota bacterium]
MPSGCASTNCRSPASASGARCNPTPRNERDPSMKTPNGAPTAHHDPTHLVRTRFEHVTAGQIRDLMLFHLKYNRGKDWRSASDYDRLFSFATAVRDLCVDRFIATQRAYMDQDASRVYYLSLEFLIGKLLGMNLLALGIEQQAREALAELGLELDQMLAEEVEAGLGNGGLGRLAACLLQSMADLQLPAYGYGLRYEYGIFQQNILDGWQQEIPDDWLTLSYPWEMARPEYTLPVLVYGKLDTLRGRGRKAQTIWRDWRLFEGVPFDIPVIGYQVHNCNILRLWSAHASQKFRLDVFNEGEYVKSVEDQNWAQTVTKVLYPSDATHHGRELRLLQEYFLCTCAIRDILRRYKKNHKDLDQFGAKNSIQLNDTHPALAVPELMRCLIDEEDLPYDRAWEITVQTLSYTNHTLLPEALERWPVDLINRVLPRHLQLIYEINARFLQHVELQFNEDDDLARRVSVIEEGPTRMVRMANLAVIGSHRVNGVSALHSELLRQHVLRDFDRIYPERLTNVTNGIDHGRWLLHCNPALAALLRDTIGSDWVRDPARLEALVPHAEDPEFRARFRAVKQANKERLAALILEQTGYQVSPAALFDVQVKRLHLYKRQLLNLLHIIYHYRRLLQHPDLDLAPRVYIFAAKAAPAYHAAKRVIKLVNSLAETINLDPVIGDRLKVIFLPDYNVSLAERIIPAADLSEQISTAGFEASGTGNMKLALNGALTIGTWDGANIEMAEHVGLENFFIFGQRVEDLQRLRAEDYSPWRWYDQDADLRATLDLLKGDAFAPGEPGLFHDLFNELTYHGDRFFHLPDFRPYIECQATVDQLYRQPEEWTRRAVLNTARMGWFSSDRTIRDYCERVWKRLAPVPVTDGDCLFPQVCDADPAASASDAQSR